MTSTGGEDESAAVRMRGQTPFTELALSALLDRTVEDAKRITQSLEQLQVFLDENADDFSLTEEIQAKRVNFFRAMQMLNLSLGRLDLPAFQVVQHSSEELLDSAAILPDGAPYTASAAQPIASRRAPLSLSAPASPAGDRFSPYSSMGHSMSPLHLALRKRVQERDYADEETRRSSVPAVGMGNPYAMRRLERERRRRSHSKKHPHSLSKRVSLSMSRSVDDLAPLSTDGFHINLWSLEAGAVRDMSSGLLRLNGEDLLIHKKDEKTLLMNGSEVMSVTRMESVHASQVKERETPVLLPGVLHVRTIFLVSMRGVYCLETNSSAHRDELLTCLDHVAHSYRLSPRAHSARSPSSSAEVRRRSLGTEHLRRLRHGSGQRLLGLPTVSNGSMTSPVTSPHPSRKTPISSGLSSVRDTPAMSPIRTPPALDLANGSDTPVASDGGVNFTTPEQIVPDPHRLYVPLSRRKSVTQPLTPPNASGSATGGSAYTPSPYSPRSPGSRRITTVDISSTAEDGEPKSPPKTEPDEPDLFSDAGSKSSVTSPKAYMPPVGNRRNSLLSTDSNWPRRSSVSTLSTASAPTGVWEQDDSTARYQNVPKGVSNGTPTASSGSSLMLQKALASTLGSDTDSEADHATEHTTVAVQPKPTTKGAWSAVKLRRPMGTEEDASKEQMDLPSMTSTMRDQASQQEETHTPGGTRRVTSVMLQRRGSVGRWKTSRVIGGPLLPASPDSAGEEKLSASKEEPDRWVVANGKSTHNRHVSMSIGMKRFLRQEDDLQPYPAPPMVVVDDVADSSAVVKGGIMQKKTQTSFVGMHMWQKRWFVLRSLTLVYYKENEDSALSGGVLVRDFLRVRYQKHKNKGCRLKLECSGNRTLNLTALRPADALSWAKTLSHRAYLCTPYALKPVPDPLASESGLPQYIRAAIMEAEMMNGPTRLVRDHSPLMGGKCRPARATSAMPVLDSEDDLMYPKLHRGVSMGGGHAAMSRFDTTVKSPFQQSFLELLHTSQLSSQNPGLLRLLYASQIMEADTSLLLFTLAVLHRPHGPSHAWDHLKDNNRDREHAAGLHGTLSLQELRVDGLSCGVNGCTAPRGQCSDHSWLSRSRRPSLVKRSSDNINPKPNRVLEHDVTDVVNECEARLATLFFPPPGVETRAFRRAVYDWARSDACINPLRVLLMSTDAEDSPWHTLSIKYALRVMFLLTLRPEKHHSCCPPRILHPPTEEVTRPSNPFIPASSKPPLMKNSSHSSLREHSTSSVHAGTVGRASVVANRTVPAAWFRQKSSADLLVRERPNPNPTSASKSPIGRRKAMKVLDVSANEFLNEQERARELRKSLPRPSAADSESKASDFFDRDSSASHRESFRRPDLQRRGSVTVQQLYSSHECEACGRSEADFCSNVAPYLAGRRCTAAVVNDLITLLITPVESLLNLSDPNSRSIMNNPVHNPTVLRTLLCCLIDSPIRLRAQVVEDLNALYIGNLVNRDLALARWGWQSWVVALLADVVPGSTHPVEQQVFRFTMNVFALLHYRSFLTREEFFDDITTSLRAIQRLYGNDQRCMVPSQTILKSLITVLNPAKSIFPHSLDARPWANVLRTAELFRIFMFWSPDFAMVVSTDQRTVDHDYAPIIRTPSASLSTPKLKGLDNGADGSGGSGKLTSRIPRFGDLLSVGIHFHVKHVKISADGHVGASGSDESKIADKDSDEDADNDDDDDVLVDRPSLEDMDMELLPRHSEAPGSGRVKAKEMLKFRCLDEELARVVMQWLKQLNQLGSKARQDDSAEEAEFLAVLKSELSLFQDAVAFISANQGVGCSSKQEMAQRAEEFLASPSSVERQKFLQHLHMQQEAASGQLPFGADISVTRGVQFVLSVYYFQHGVRMLTSMAAQPEMTVQQLLDNTLAQEKLSRMNANWYLEHKGRPLDVTQKLADIPLSSQSSVHLLDGMQPNSRRPPVVDRVRSRTVM